MFGFCLSYLVTLVLLYKGSSNIVALTDIDSTFLHSDPMKWAIIFLAMILIFGTMVDLYLSLVIRTYYLVQFYYPDGAQSEAKYLVDHNKTDMSVNMTQQPIMGKKK